jgi:hypothetical protein
MQMSTIPMVALRQIIPIEDVYGAYEVSRVLNGVPGRVTPHFARRAYVMQFIVADVDEAGNHGVQVQLGLQLDPSLVGVGQGRARGGHSRRRA